MALNEYTLGIRQAELSTSQLEPFWGGTNLSRHFMNKAFEFYFKARQHVNSAPLPYRRQMQSSLDGLANTGWAMIGVGDLIDGFQHLVAAGGIWRDTNVSDYVPRTGSAFYPHAVRSAAGVVSFVNALDANNEEFGRDVLERSRDLNAQLEGASSRQLWGAVAEILSKLHSIGEQAIPKIWPDMNACVPIGGGTVSVRVETVASALQLLRKLKGSLDVYSEASNRGLSEDHARALAALRMAASYVPGLGTIYTTFIDMVPAMATVVNEYARRANVIYDSVAARTQRGLLAPEVNRPGGR